VPEDTPIASIGDPKHNIGIYALAILNQPEITLPGKIVLAETETRSAGDMVDLWSDASGKPAEYVQVSLEQYDSQWPSLGREIGLMLQYWDAVRERSWTADPGPILTKEDLKISGLVGMRDVFSAIEW
jgi:hypothetical protein